MRQQIVAHCSRSIFSCTSVWFIFEEKVRRLRQGKSSQSHEGMVEAWVKNSDWVSVNNQLISSVGWIKDVMGLDNTTAYLYSRQTCGLRTCYVCIRGSWSKIFKHLLIGVSMRMIYMGFLMSQLPFIMFCFHFSFGRYRLPIEHWLILLQKKCGFC